MDGRELGREGIAGGAGNVVTRSHQARANAVAVAAHGIGHGAVVCILLSAASAVGPGDWLAKVWNDRVSTGAA